jgi:nitrite reductase/ring-hydroxylating ferredoxin subunit
MADGSVKAFDNVCLHRQSQVVTGCGTAKRFTCPYHAWTYDNAGRLVGVPGREGVPEVTVKSDGLTELPAAEFAGFLWVALDPLDTGATLDVAAHLGPLADELDSWGFGRWSPLGEKVLDSPINWKLAVDTFAENYHFATVHRQTFATIARSNCTVFDSYGPHHRLIFPLNTILELDNVPENQWDPFHNMVVINALFPNTVLSVTIANGELFRSTPATNRVDPSPFTRTPHRWTSPTNPWPPAHRPSSTMRMPRCATRTTDWSRDCKPTSSPAPATICCSGATNPDCSIATSRGTRQLQAHRQPSPADPSSDSTEIRSSRMVASGSFRPGRTFVNTSSASPRRPETTNGTT